MPKLTKQEEFDLRYQSICDAKTGECINIDLLVHEYLYLHKQQDIQRYRKLKRQLGKEIFDIGGYYCMIYTDEIAKLGLTLEEKGAFITLTEYLIKDGSCRIFTGTTTLVGYAKLLEIGKNRVKTILEGLKHKRAIYYDNLSEILINPMYYRFGKYINNDKAIEVFKVPMKQ